jgi:hypothetical protein
LAVGSREVALPFVHVMFLFAQARFCKGREHSAHGGRLAPFLSTSTAPSPLSPPPQGGRGTPIAGGRAARHA